MSIQSDSDELRQGEGRTLTEVETRRYLSSYALPFGQQVLAVNEEEAVTAADKIGYPIVLKLVSPDVIHKSDVGGVKVNLTDMSAVRKAYREIVSIGKSRSGIAVDGITVQPMIDGVAEMILGIKRDETFGPVAMVGFGGTAVELVKDVELLVCPLDRPEARAALDRLKCIQLIRGFRGRPPADEEALLDVIQIVSDAAMSMKCLEELDLNPIIVRERGKGVFIVDARARLT